MSLSADIPNERTLLRLMQLASPALPVGAYSYSEGLEYVAQAGVVKDSATLGAWIEDGLAFGAGQLEAAVMVRVYDAWQQNDLALFEGVLPLLADLKARHHCLAVATGKSRRGLDEALRSVELKSLFDGSRTADETAGKPDPRMLLELMAELGTPPERTLMVGDTTHDLQMALNADCPSVGVSYGAHAPDTFHDLKPLFVANSVAQLQQWLRDHA